jgi:dTMP kinase
LAIGGTIPDITFIIDVPAEIAEERKRNKELFDLDRIEIAEREFFEKVRNGYLEIASKERRFKVIDGTDTIKEIHNRIINEIKLFESKEL